MVVARREAAVVAVLFSAARSQPSVAPVVQAMLAAWPGSESSYIYGPVCIAQAERGQGLLRKLYEALP